MLSQQQRDEVRTQALDRQVTSGRRNNTSNYSLKMRPVIVKDLTMFQSPRTAAAVAHKKKSKKNKIKLSKPLEAVLSDGELQQV